MQALSVSGRSRLSVTCRKAEGEMRQSRIGAKPVPLPKGVTVSMEGRILKVKVRAWHAPDVTAVFGIISST